MRVLADYHHDDLYYSLHLLFAKRLGFELYQPVGMAWKEHGYWDYGHLPDVWAQYLGEHRITGTASDGSYHLLYNHRHDIHYKGLTLEQFRANPCDIILSSTTNNDGAYDRLQYDCAPRAKRIAHVGNIGQWTDVPNVLLTTAWVHPRYRSYVQVHQEFDLDVYRYVPPVSHNSITSFVNCLPVSDYWSLYQRLVAALPEFRFAAHGIVCPQGNVDSKQEIGNIMLESAFGFHAKAGDGYGHTVHSWYACGRPCIVNLSVYSKGIAGRLMEDGVTCIDGEKADAVDRIRYFADPERHAQMCEAAYRRFGEVVNFDEDERKVRDWLGNLL